VIALPVLRKQIIPIQAPNDIVVVRQKVRALTTELRFSLVDQTKMVTAASELARNALEHGKGGQVQVELVEDDPRRGLRLTFEDQGPGIPNIDLALKDGYTTGNGLGLGLSGAKRLVNEFEIESAPGKGTRVTVARWR
jgi:serine/threonine-protein kinase RsbT